MINGTANSKFVAKEDFNSLQKEVRILEEAQLKQKELTLSSISISKDDLKGLKAEIIMWVVGIIIAFGALIFIVLNQRVEDINVLSQRIDVLNQKIDDVKEDISANKVAIAENKIMIQRVLDKLDEMENKS